MAYLYGDRVSDAEVAALTERLIARGNPSAIAAARVCARGIGREATATDSREARATILQELIDWADLDGAAPGLAAVRDRLARDEARRIA